MMIFIEFFIGFYFNFNIFLMKYNDIFNVIWFNFYLVYK
jgi:hypothetical protein